ncbi:diguanylate cyclase [Psychrosphaera sp. F3M07]|uniref:GGDEF domain-containing protein n=1 Tax=Psychrosphaera sp. F3M07 TaxID=2841560 RepID=UPI001C084519|nr:GGDEF domain-containing protein [Psychrosphaera sp. F3M07]MBU2918645.1 diguanylate cyclase [Psychrosphaera sp. F3M07]
MNDNVDNEKIKQALQVKAYKASFGLVERLSHVTKGSSPELDIQLTKLRKLVVNDADYQSVINAIESANLKVKSLEQFQQKSQISLKDALIESGEILQSTTGIPDNLRRQLRMVVNKLKSGTVSIFTELQPQTIQLLELFSALKNTNNSTNAPESFNITKILVDSLDNLANNEILVPSLDKRLIQIKNTTVEKDKLNLCIKTFAEVIEQFGEEFKQTQTLVLSINSALEEVQQVLVDSLANSKHYDLELAKLNIQIEKQIHELSQKSGQTNNVEQLKGLINSKLNSITESIKKKEDIEKQRTEELNSSLSKMETKLSKMEERTSFYRTKWLEEKSRSETDALTGLPNRGAYDKRFDEEFHRWIRHPEPLCLAVLDLDHFKSINDKYGHSVGDKTLQIVAKTLRKHFRVSDYVARYGGEEFVCILTNTDPKESMLALEKVRLAIEAIPFSIKKDRLNITVSIGVTALKATDNTHTVFDRADKALYEAKHTGRNKTCYKK